MKDLKVSEMADLRRDFRLAERKTEIVIALGAAILVLAGVSQAATSGSLLDPEGSSGELAAEYRFDTGAGNTAYDSMNGNDATLDNFDFDSSSGWSDGVKGKAVEFDGSNDQVKAPSDFEFYDSDSDPWTISVWFKIQTRASTAGHDMTIFDNNNRYHMQLESSNDELQSIPGGNSFVWGWSPSKGRWHHAVLVYDGNGNIDAYANGELVREVSGITPYESGKAGGRVIMGSHGGSRFFDGKIDNAKVLTDNISKSQVRSLYNSGYLSIGQEESRDPSKIVDMSFTQQNSSHAQDTSGYNNHGRKQGGVTQESAGGCKVGRCMKFDGTFSTGIDMNDVWSDHMQSRTFMLWFKEDEDGADVRDRIISQDCSEWFCFRDEGKDKVLLAVDGFVNTPTYTLDQDQWHHVALSFNESDSTVDVYLDGRKADSISYSPSWSHETRPIVLGGNTEGSDDVSGSHWEGKIDEFKVYSKPLTQNEVLNKIKGLKSDGAVLDTRLNGDGGDYVEDRSPESNHGRLKPDASTGPERVSSSRGGALRFDGVNDDVDIIGDSSLHLSDGTWTQVLWAKGEYGAQNRNALRVGQGWQTILGIYSPDTWRAGFYNGTGWEYVTADVDTSDLHQIVYVSRQDRVELWVDGDRIDTLDTTGSPPASRDAGTAVIGSVGNARYFKGMIDDVEIYQEPLSRSRIEKIYETGKPQLDSTSRKTESRLQDSLIISQTFDRVEECGLSDTISCLSGVSGDVAVDESGQANHADLVNSPKRGSPASCKRGSCLRFTQSHADVPAPDSLPSGDSSFTTSLWFRDKGTADDSGLLHWGVNEPKSASGQEIRSDGWQHYFYGKDLNCYDIGLQDGNWHHLAVTFDPVSDTRSMYMDGELECQDDPGEVNINRTEVQIGNGDASSEFNDGLIDQVRVYNRSLSDQEVWKLYTMGRDRSSSEERAGPSASWNLGSELRIQSDRSGSMDGRWNSAGPASEKRYIVNEYHAGRELRVVSYDRSNTVRAGSCSTDLARGDTHTFSSSCYSVGDVVDGQRPFSAHFQSGGSDGPVPVSFIGTEFVYGDCRDAEYFNIVAPDSSATVTISNSTGEVKTASIPSGGHKEVTTDMPQSVYKISSSSPVLVSYDRDMGDTYMMRPMAEELYGMMENIYVGKDSTDVRVYSSDGGKIHDGTFGSYTNLGGEGSFQDGSKSVHAVADKAALGGYRCADGDDGETDIGISDNDLAHEWYLPEPVAGAGNNPEDKYFSLTTSAQARCSVYWPNGTRALTKSSSNTAPYPGYIGFDTHNDLNISEAGARVSCTEPAAMQWEPSSYEGEANLYGIRKTPEGKRGSAIRFDGENDMVQAGDVQYSEDAVSVGAWVKQTGSATSRYQRITDASGGELVYWVNDANRDTCVRISATRSGERSQTCFDTDLKKNKWYHLLFTYDAAESETKLYVNGELHGTSSYYSGKMDGTAPDFVIGNRNAGNRPWKGLIDDVRVYPYVLNQDQVKQVMNSGGISSG